MNASNPKFDFVRKKICPYCQSKIKATSDFIVCPNCGTPHHKECWEENHGCTTYGCINNPHSEKKIELEGTDVGDQTIESIRTSISTPEQPNEIECPNCKSKIEETSVFCKYCGYKIHNDLNPESKINFEKEFKRRYRDKLSFTRKRIIITLASAIILAGTLIYLFYSTVTKLNAYFSSDEYQIESVVNNWRNAWQNKDIEKYKSYMTPDYEYYGKDGKKTDFSERIRRIESNFKNAKEIKITFDDFKMINDSTSTANDKRVQFNQTYEADKYKEKGLKTLRLYKGPETNDEWKIYREFLE